MKFAQYLRDTQTPEWKKAYIDYRGLKKRITAIRKAEQGVHFAGSPDDSPNGGAAPPSTPKASDVGNFPRPLNPPSSLKLAESSTGWATLNRRNTAPKAEQGFSSALQDPVVEPTRRASFVGGRNRSNSYHHGAKSLSSRLGGAYMRPTNPLATLPLHDILLQLSPHEIAFFTMLDDQLEKVESFYLSREKETIARGKTLETQLHELTEHRKLFLEAHMKVPWAAAIASALKPKKRKLRVTRTMSMSQPEQNKTGGGKRPFLGLFSPSSMKSRQTSTSGESVEDRKVELEESAENSPGSDDDIPHHPEAFSADPDNYLYAKRKLKKAVIEHYRGLELLHNYRVLNITGFRKALKKFEKVTKIPVQNQYMMEKIEKSAFASDKVVSRMMREMEEMYATTFVQGNKKKAMKRLRGGNRIKSHHFSTFRSGLLLGLAIPALIAGFVEAFRTETRQALPGWGALMVVYATLFIPTLFVALVGLNLLVWARARINYVFIFELNTTTALDYREYFETPSILLAGLAYCFWLSFARIGAPNISPTVWPLIWLGCTTILVLNPFPILFSHTRFWLIRVIATLFLTGTRRIEFTDFWMGDQFCSLVFPLTNLYTLGCVYNDGFSSDWQTNCGLSSSHWPIAFMLAILPFILRLVQSLKRYHDSGLVTHLINGGKYGAGIVSYMLYYIWRHHGTKRAGALFAFWCIFNTISAVYACTWDFLMDWSVLRLHSPNILLRPELVYTSYVSMYYIAIVTNALLRFSWVIYVPHWQGGPDMVVRSFIVGMLELLRRWQWNFYRLENEHLGNMDQYRVTREVPLPYLFDDPRREEDADDDDDEAAVRR